MTRELREKDEDKLSDTDSEAASYREQQVNKLSAIIYPTVCALLLVTLFGGSFLATRMVYERYDSWASTAPRFDLTKLRIAPFTNFTASTGFKAPLPPIPGIGRI